MARKVFISFLGTGPYSKCHYTKPGENYEKTTYFIQIATLDYLMKVGLWGKKDLGLILLTKKAEEEVWGDPSKNDINKQELKPRLDEMNLPFEVKPIKNIPEGDSEADLMQIFMKVFNELEDGDELYFDITFGFRYLPMLVMVLINYSKFNRTCKVKWISYGKVTRSTSPSIPSEGTIIDLVILSTLQDWTTGAADFVDNGNVDKLVKLSSNELNSKLIIRNDSEVYSENEKEVNEKIKEFTKTLTQVIDDIKMCRGVEVINGDQIKKLREQRDKIDLTASAFGPILDKIMDSLKGFSSERDVFNGLEAANWCLDHSLYQQAITYVEETLTTIVGEQYNIDLKDRKKREIISNGFSSLYYLKTTKSKQSKEVDESINEDNLQFLDRIINENAFVNNYYISVQQIKDIRNDINHAGMRVARSAVEMKEKIQFYIDCLTRSLKENESTRSFEFNPNRVIIISNQPLSQKDIEGLRSINRPIDVEYIDYPNFFEEEDDQKSSKQIRDEVNNVFDQIISQSNSKPCYLLISNRLRGKLNKKKSYNALISRIKQLRYKQIVSIKEIE